MIWNRLLRSISLKNVKQRHKCFSVNFVKFLGTTFLQVTVSHNMKAYV